jgi:hypothetical protein
VYKSIKLVLLLLLTGVAAATTNAQSPSSTPVPLKHYKVDFVVKEADANGHVTNSRSYSTVLATTNQNDPNQIRSGDRVPIRVGLNDKGDNNLQYVDIGVSFDCRFVQEIDQKLAMKIKAEISSIPAGSDLNAGIDPVIRQFQWNSDVLIPTGVPTTIFSSDDVNSKTRIQLEITAAPIK